MPLLRSGGVTLGRELLKGASGVLDDVQNRKFSKDSMRERGMNVLSNVGKSLIGEMDGTGYKPSVKRRRTQSSVKRSSVKSVVKRKSAVKKSSASKTKKKKKCSSIISGRVSKAKLFAKRPDYFSL